MDQYNRCPQLQLNIEQFYYREAQCLDDRRFNDWLIFLNEQIKYTIPGRYAPQRDLSKRGTQEFLSIDDELERPSPESSPLREEGYLSLAFRAERAYKHNAWASNPPPRTRRFISNVMIKAVDDTYAVNSNFLIYFSRHRDDQVIYAGQRRDVLVASDDDFTILSREIIFDWNTITAPTLGLFF